MKTKRIQLLTQCFLLSVVECGLHSLVFMSTGRVQPGDRPAFEQLTVFDGVPISHCDGSTVDLKPALESKHLPDHCQEAEYNILESLHEIPPRINNRISVVQRRRGCILSATGTVSGFEAWSVDGMDFMTFDPESRRWTSQSSSAVTVERRWNNKQEMNVAFSWFIRERCPQMIQMIKLRSIIPKTELYVFGKPMATPGQALLTCHLMSTDRSSSLHLITDQTSRPIRITETGPVPDPSSLRVQRWVRGRSWFHGPQRTWSLGFTVGLCPGGLIMGVRYPSPAQSVLGTFHHRPLVLDHWTSPEPRGISLCP